MWNVHLSGELKHSNVRTGVRCDCRRTTSEAGSTDFIAIPEEGNYFMDVFQLLDFLIPCWGTENPHHSNDEFSQFRDVKGTVLSLLLYQLQIKCFSNLIS